MLAARLVLVLGPEQEDPPGLVPPALDNGDSAPLFSHHRPIRSCSCSPGFCDATDGDVATRSIHCPSVRRGGGSPLFCRCVSVSVGFADGKPVAPPALPTPCSGFFGSLTAASRLSIRPMVREANFNVSHTRSSTSDRRTQSGTSMAAAPQKGSVVDRTTRKSWSCAWFNRITSPAASSRSMRNAAVDSASSL
jgi:hypothetical protein